jgi:hypothetical protein
MTLYITPDGKFHDDANGLAIGLPTWPIDARIATEQEVSEAFPTENEQPSPVVVSMRQARLALLEAGILDSVYQAIETLPSPQKEAAHIEWEYAQEVNKESPIVAMLAQGLSLNDEQLDQLFIRASQL